MRLFVYTNKLTIEKGRVESALQSESKDPVLCSNRIPRNTFIEIIARGEAECIYCAYCMRRSRVL